MEENLINYVTDTISFMFDCETQYGNNIRITFNGTGNFVVRCKLIGLYLNEISRGPLSLLRLQILKIITSSNGTISKLMYFKAVG
jgi:hypothetical protein